MDSPGSRKSFLKCNRTFLPLLLIAIICNWIIPVCHAYTDSLDAILNEIPDRVKSLTHRLLPNGLPLDIVNFYTPTHVNNSVCLQHSTQYRDELQNYTRWAFQMYDSSGKVPSGLLRGHLNDLGNYEECIQASQIAPYPVQFCVIRIGNVIRMPKNPVDWDTIQTIVGGIPAWKPYINLGVCLPASCDRSDIFNHYSAIVNKLNLTIHLDEYSCTASNEEKPYTTLDWVTTVVVTVIMFSIYTSTIIDYFFPTEKPSTFRTLVKSLSAYNNGRKLFEVRSSKRPLTVLNGIRFLSVMWVMVSHHCLFSSVRPAMNYIRMSNFYTKFYGAIVLNGILAVDTFIILNGFLLSYYFILHKREGIRFSLPGFYLHRLIRVLPAYILTLLCAMTFFERYYGDGPLWKHYVQREMDTCRKNWWTNLLFVNNYIHPDHQCIPSTWYLSVDMQLYILSPLILIPLYNIKGFAKYCLPILIWAGITVTFLNSYLNYIPAGSVIARDYRTSIKHRGEYVTTHTKFGHWLIGIALGYIIQNIEKPIKLSKATVAICWILSFIAAFCVLFGISYFHQDHIPYNRLASSTYTGLSSAIWAVCICWLIFACEMGYGGPVHTFLSWGLFQPLGKLTFMIYLTHVALQFGIVGNHKTSPNVEVQSLLFDVAGEMFVMVLLAPILCLLGEAPFINLEKAFKKLAKRSTSKSVKEEETKGQTIVLMNGNKLKSEGYP